MITCPTCGARCEIGGRTTHYFQPQETAKLSSDQAMLLAAERYVKARLAWDAFDAWNDKPKSGPELRDEAVAAWRDLVAVYVVKESSGESS